MSNDNRSFNLDQPPAYLLPDAATCLAALNTVNSEPYTQEHIHAFVASKLAGRKLFSAGISLAVNLAIVDATQLRELPSMIANILMMDIDEYTAALIAVALPSGIGGGLGPIFVDIDDAPPTDHAATFTALLRCVRHSDLADAEKDAFYDGAFLALDRWTDERKAEALAVVVMALTMRELATKGSSNG